MIKLEIDSAIQKERDRIRVKRNNDIALWCQIGVTLVVGMTIGVVIARVILH